VLIGIVLIIKPGLIISDIVKYSSAIFINPNSFLKKHIIMLIQLPGCFNIAAAVSGAIAILGYRKNRVLKYLLIIFFSKIADYGCSAAFDLTAGVIGIIEVIEIPVLFPFMVTFLPLFLTIIKSKPSLSKK
jgi:hypothetical protein